VARHELDLVGAARTAPSSDSKLRDLERRWRRTGSVEDEAAYLIERVRVGDLTQERLDLAAYCGHEAATRASSRRHKEPEDLRSFGGRVSDCGKQACVVLALAGTELMSPFWAEEEISGGVPHDRRVDLSIEKARAWLASSVSEQRDRLSVEAAPIPGLEGSDALDCQAVLAWVVSTDEGDVWARTGVFSVGPAGEAVLHLGRDRVLDHVKRAIRLWALAEAHSAARP
jgi:hypothetical protein